MGGSPTRHWRVTTEKSPNGTTWATIRPDGFTTTGLGHDGDPGEAIAEAMRDLLRRLESGPLTESEAYREQQLERRES